MLQVIQAADTVRRKGRDFPAHADLRRGIQAQRNRSWAVVANPAANTISGFSTSGGTSLDLDDITFTNPSQATFSGTATSGILTVTDGVHTANIDLLGDYLTATFVASADGHGGTSITTQVAEAIGKG